MSKGIQDVPINCQYQHNFQMGKHRGRQRKQNTAPSIPMEVLAWSDGSISLIRPCVDCGRSTGNYCSGGISIDKETIFGSGPRAGSSGILTVECDQCFAKDHVPQEEWNQGQRTPFCSPCEEKFTFCRFCRKVHGCTPPSWE